MRKQFILAIIAIVLIIVLQARGSSAAQCPKGHFEEIDGIVSMEAENFKSNSGWNVRTSKSGYSGSGYLEGGGGATAKYSIKFNRTGTYWVHIRSVSTNDIDNGAYAYLDGKTITGKIYFVKTGGWVWWATKQGSSRNTKISFKLSSPGTHEFSIKPGVASGQTAKIDKIVVHLDGKFNSSGDGGLKGAGPAQTDQCGGQATTISGARFSMLPIQDAYASQKIFSLQGRCISQLYRKELTQITLPQSMYLKMLQTENSIHVNKLK